MTFNIDHAEEELHSGHLPILEHMALFEQIRRAAEADSQDSTSGLDFYNDGAAHHPDFNDYLSRSLLDDDMIGFMLNDGTVIAWDESSRSWKDDGRDIQTCLESLFMIDASDLDQTMDDLNEIGNIIRKCESEGLAVASELKDAGARLIVALGKQCDLETGPTDTDGIWAWDDKSLLYGEGWVFDLDERDDQ